MLPPGVQTEVLYYIKVTDKTGRVSWVARYVRRGAVDRWNIGPYYADGFDSLSYAKKLARQLSKRINYKDAEFTIHAVTSTPDIHQVHPVEVLDALARV